MKILALEFSSAVRSVAVGQWSGGRCEALAETTSDTGAVHPLRLIEAALRQAGAAAEEVAIIAVGLGPGSYTGIRSSIAVAQGLSLARPVKLCGHSSMAALAAEAHAQTVTGDVRFLIDAQRGEFYAADYRLDASGARETKPLRLVSRAEANAGESGVLAGPGIKSFFPAALDVFPVARFYLDWSVEKEAFVPGNELEPIYLRQTTFVKAPPPRVI